MKSQVKFSAAWCALANKVVRSNLQPPVKVRCKVAVVAYARSSNLGDDIQTLSVLKCLPSNVEVVPVDREDLASFSSTEPVKCIINGWFMDDPRQWPPSPSLRPLFIGFHAATDEVLCPTLAAYYRQFEPIGCRDHVTVERFRLLGVEAYFSGCPTLTLRRLPALRKPGTVVVVDADRVTCDWHTSDTRSLLAEFLPLLGKAKVSYRTHRIPFWMGSWPALKLLLGLRRIRDYSCASLVITNRLHVALPCLALGTACAFLHQDMSQGRIASYREMFQDMLDPSRCKEVMGKGESIAMRTDVSDLRRNMIQRIREFLESPFGTWVGNEASHR